MRTVDGILSALGFQSSDEVAKFCASVNVIEAFSDVEFVRQFINDEDRRDLVRLGQIRNKIKLAPTIFIFKPAGSVFDFKVNPGYDDFFQFLYAYVTRGNSFGERENFIKYWKDNYSKETSYALRTNSEWYFVRASFKKQVDEFLAGLRAPKSQDDAGSGSPFVDLVHNLKNKVINILLTPSDWGYIQSGDEGAVTIGTPVLQVDAGGGGGEFSVFEKSSPKKLHPLIHRYVSLGVGIGPSFPYNVILNPSAFPDTGKIYHGIGYRIAGIHSFYGISLTIAAGAADVANQTSAFMFIAPFHLLAGVPYANINGENYLQVITAIISRSNAILSLDGHGIEASISVSAQVLLGVVKPK
jgi:hypothetical protein